MGNEYKPLDNKEQPLCFFPVPFETLQQEINITMERAVKDLIERLGKEEKMLAPKAACALFDPQITPQTLALWSKKGHIKIYRVGNSRPFYKQSEILEAVKTLKKYKR
jgi:hypothetical protein